MTQAPVVMVHGFASSYERNWREPGWGLLDEQGRTVIGVDLPGHGTAGKPHDPAAYADLEQAIVAAMPAGQRADAIGFSLGAQLLLRAAAAQPGRFRRIVIGGAGDNVFASAGDDATAAAIETARSPAAVIPPWRRWRILPRHPATTGRRWPPASAGRGPR